MAPKRKTTRLNPDATPTPVTDTHTTTSVTNAQIQAMINEGVTAALAARDATSIKGDESLLHEGCQRPVQVALVRKDGVRYSIATYIACHVKLLRVPARKWLITLWNSMLTTTPEVSHAMPWRTTKKMMTEKYCPRGELKETIVEMGI
ncbi:hypothetical protein Tco_0676817 [Tanacetum coccineum]